MIRMLFLALLFPFWLSAQTNECATIFGSVAEVAVLSEVEAANLLGELIDKYDLSVVDESGKTLEGFFVEIEKSPGRIYLALFDIDPKDRLVWNMWIGEFRQEVSSDIDILGTDLVIRQKTKFDVDFGKFDDELRLQNLPYTQNKLMTVSRKTPIIKRTFTILLTPKKMDEIKIRSLEANADFINAMTSIYENYNFGKTTIEGYPSRNLTPKISILSDSTSIFVKDRSRGSRSQNVLSLSASKDPSEILPGSSASFEQVGEDFVYRKTETRANRHFISEVRLETNIVTGRKIIILGFPNDIGRIELTRKLQQ